MRASEGQVAPTRPRSRQQAGAAQHPEGKRGGESAEPTGPSHLKVGVSALQGLSGEGESDADYEAVSGCKVPHGLKKGDTGRPPQ